MVLDLDGVVFRGDEAVPGADGFLNRLAAARLGIVAVTNHAGRTPEAVSAKLSGLGLRIDAAAVVTSACVTAAYLAREGVTSARVVGTSSLARALTEAGVRVEATSTEAVVVGYAPDATFGELAAAAQVVHAGARFVATNDDGSVPNGAGIWPDAGATVAFLSAASGRAPTVVGKPARWPFEEGLRRLGLVAADVAVVGDTLATDIRGGNAVGCRTLWLDASGTGVAASVEASSRPTWIARDPIEAAAILLAAARGEEGARG